MSDSCIKSLMCFMYAMSVNFNGNTTWSSLAKITGILCSLYDGYSELSAALI